MNRALVVVFSSICIVFKANSQQLSATSDSSTRRDWPCYGRDPGGSRYSPLREINDHNVSSLQLAWTYRTGELETYAGTRAIEKAAFEATPVMLQNTLYFSTPTCRVMAVDASTGIQKWVFDPGVNLHKDYSEISSRGVSVWPGAGGAAGPAAQRIFAASIDGRLFALDAGSGKLISSFGRGGSIDLHEGLGPDISETSPPAIIGNMVVIGSSLGDNQRINYPRGTVRAYDAISGALRWSWDPVPQTNDDPAFKTWTGPNAHGTGAANAWSLISADPVRDLVFIPTSCPSTDYYGGERLGQNLYGNSIVALRASTGKLVWYFQVVHHDLWDYDIAAQPMLIELKKGGMKIPAVAVGTKMGHVFILNRETGVSLFPIEERPMPKSDVPGEQAWPTQPVPLLPAPLGLQQLSGAGAWGFTDKDKQEAKDRIAHLRNEGPFTPASYGGTVMVPGNVGGIHWGGMCYDPSQKLLVTNINRIAAIVTLIPRSTLEQVEKDNPMIMRAETGMQTGTPYVMKRDYLFIIKDGAIMPQTAPPWGTLLAIDVDNGAKKWEVPLGYMIDPQQHAGAKNWGSINFGGAIVTAGNLIFVAASLDNHLRAFNTLTGEEVWNYLLPAGGQATPMTYESHGKQYLVIAAGGHGKLKTKQGDYVLAFSMP